MNQSIDWAVIMPTFPDHTQLPESDGGFVKNIQEHPQSILLTASIGNVLDWLPPVELGLWSGFYQSREQLWLRWWDDQGNLLLIGKDCARPQAQRADQERHEMIFRLLPLSLSLDQITPAVGVSLARVQQVPPLT